MKLKCAFLSFCFIIGLSAEETAWYKAFLARIETMKQQPTKENVISMADEITTHDRYSYARTEEEKGLNKKAIEELTKIPNHAKYLTEHLESIRISDADGGKNTSENNRNRYGLIIETMVHLQSPEIIQALGHYLYDERDTPPPPTPKQDWVSAPSNAYYAAQTLCNIGLKNAPVPKTKWAKADDLATWRLWWEQLQAGNRTFSFEGQDTVFRLKKNGEIERLSPNEASSMNHARNTVPATGEAAVTVRGGHRKVFIISAICLLAAAVFFHFRQKNRKL
jgi:hypothetical protein